MTGKVRDGKFDHNLPKELADLFEDAAKLLRQHGSSAIHMAVRLSAPSENPEVDGLTDPKHAHDMTVGKHHMNRAYTHTRGLMYWIQNIVSHAGRDEDHEDDGLRGCRSCNRNAGHWEPTERLDTHYCYWCRAFRNTYGMEPPVPILVARHQGRRITQAMLEAHGVTKPKGPTRS